MSMKPKLAELANATFGEMWLKSCLRDKIVIGHHKFDNNAGAHNLRYRNIYSGKYDGVQFYGPNGRKDFTKSLMTILTFTFPTQFLPQSPRLSAVDWPELGGSYPRTRPQPENEQRNPISEIISVKTSNRFSILNQNPNLGNF